MTIKKEENNLINILTEIPIILAIFIIGVFINNWIMFLVTIVDEIVFRMIFFIYLDKNVLNSVLSAIFYALYSYFLVGIKSVSMIYFLLGFVYSIASKKYSIAELILFRLCLNIFLLKL
jgi:hypothetical protein